MLCLDHELKLLPGNFDLHLMFFGHPESIPLASQVSYAEVEPYGAGLVLSLFFAFWSLGPQNPWIFSP